MSSEGVLIFPVKSIHAPYRAPYQPNCSPQGPTTVKSGHSQFRSRPCLPDPLRAPIHSFPGSSRFCFSLLPHAVALAQSLTIEQIRVIGNRRIPKETVLARLFTHVGDTYDPISIERDFNSLWNTGYFEDSAH